MSYYINDTMSISSDPYASYASRFPAVLKAKAVTSEILVTLMRTGKKKTVDIFAIP